MMVLLGGCVLDPAPDALPEPDAAKIVVFFPSDVGAEGGAVKGAWGSRGYA